MEMAVDKKRVDDLYRRYKGTVVGHLILDLWEEVIGLREELRRRKSEGLCGSGGVEVVPFHRARTLLNVEERHAGLENENRLFKSSLLLSGEDFEMSKKINTNKDILSLAEAAEYMGVSIAKVKDWAAEGLIPAGRLSERGKFIIIKEDLLTAIRKTYKIDKIDKIDKVDKVESHKELLKELAR